MPTANQKANWIFISSILIVLVVTMTPGNGKIAGNYLDKVVHFLIFFFLGYALMNKFSADKRISFFLIWAVLFGIITEIVQQYIPGRGMDIYDALADGLGVLCGSCLFSRNSNRN